MVDYTEKLRADLAEQFKGQPVLDALIEAIGEQLNDVRKFFSDLRTQRSVQTAIGKQLDGIGDNVVLNRREAGDMVSYKQPDYILDDEQYRVYLIYKIWRNSCSCTYWDIIKAFKMFWDKPLYYSERLDKPATMFFETDELSPDDDVYKILTAPFVKSAGVAIVITAITVTRLPPAQISLGCAMGRGVQSTTLPEIKMDINLQEGAEFMPASQNIAVTKLPELEIEYDFKTNAELSASTENITQTKLPETEEK